MKDYVKVSRATASKARPTVIAAQIMPALLAGATAHGLNNQAYYVRHRK
jgi:hypothetical protein